MPDIKTSTMSFITPILRISYISLFAPRLPMKPKPGDRARYEATGLILPKEKLSKADQDRLQAMLLAGIEAGRNSELGKERFEAMLREGKVKVLRTDVESSGHPAEFKQFFRAWTYGIGAAAAGPNNVPPAKVGAPPGIVSEYKDPNTGRPTVITDPTKVYSGCWARMSVKPFFTNFEGKNPSISWQLNNVQIVRPPEGYTAERLDGKTDATQEFDATEEMPAEELAAVANGGDVDELAALLG